MTKTFKNFLMMGASPVLTLIAGPVFAQSTGTQAIETVVVSAESLRAGGIMNPITVPKERSTITQEFLNTQSPSQTVFESLNNVPGFNFTQGDPFGGAGGNVRLHGFDGNRISFTWDGMPMNDTGNYAIFTGQVADSEIIASASVHQGTTDVDSPTAAATGGVISVLTDRPKQDFSLLGDFSYGSFNHVELSDIAQ